MTTVVEDADLVEMVTALARRDLTNLQVEYGVTDVMPSGVVDLLVRTGLWAIGIDDEFGGQGASIADMLTVVRHLAAVDPAAAIALLHNHVTAQVFAATGRTDLVEASSRGPVAIAGFTDVLEAGTTAEVLRLDLGIAPTVVVLLSRTDDAVAVVQREDVTADEPHRRSGLAGLGTSSGSVRVDSVIGSHLDVARQLWRVGTATAALGAATAAADVAGNYLRQRHQFGSALIDLPAVAAAEVRLQVDLAGANAALSALIGSLDQPSAVRTAGALRCCSTAVSAALAAIQLLGGYGYLEEYGIARTARDCISLRAVAADAG